MWTPSFHDSARDLHSSSPRLQSREPKNKLQLKLESHACSRILLNSIRSVYLDDWSGTYNISFVLSHMRAICFRNSSKHLFSEVNKRNSTSSQLHTIQQLKYMNCRKTGWFLRRQLYSTKYITIYFATANHLCCNSANPATMEKFPVILRLQIHHNHCQWWKQKTVTI